MKTMAIGLFAVAMLGTTTVLADGHGEDFLIGIDPQTNQLKVEYDPGIYPFALPWSEEPLLAGWALDDPGLIALEEDDVEPGEFELLDPAADVYLRVLSVSQPAMKMWDPLAPGEQGFQISGDRHLHLGGPDFHMHAWWHVDLAEPGFGFEQSPWEITFQLYDAAGVHAPTDAIAVTFTPEPGTAILALGLMALVRRR
jgi:hypothetical protein